MASLSEQLTAAKSEIARLEERCRTLEDVLSRLMAARNTAVAPAGGTVSEEEYRMLRGMTQRQHAVCQMIARGATNAEIGKRMNITENGAKSHVRLAMLRLGVNNRAQVSVIYKSLMDRIPDHEYRVIANLPVDWDAKWKPGDPYTKEMKD